MQTFSKGPKYWENSYDYEKAKESIITGIKWFTQSLNNKHGVATPSFPEWKQAVSSAIVDEKVSCTLTKLTKENIHWTVEVAT